MFLSARAPFLSRTLVPSVLLSSLALFLFSLAAHLFTCAYSHTPFCSSWPARLLALSPMFLSSLVRKHLHPPLLLFSRARSLSFSSCSLLTCAISLTPLWFTPPARLRSLVRSSSLLVLCSCAHLHCFTRLLSSHALCLTACFADVVPLPKMPPLFLRDTLRAGSSHAEHACSANLISSSDQLQAPKRARASYIPPNPIPRAVLRLEPVQPFVGSSAAADVCNDAPDMPCDHDTHFTSDTSSSTDSVDSVLPFEQEDDATSNAGASCAIEEDGAAAQVGTSSAAEEEPPRAEDPDGVVAALILASDETHMDHRGKAKGHPVYLTLGNIDKDDRWQPYGQVLLALLPEFPVEYNVVDKMQVHNYIMREVMQSLKTASYTGIAMKNAAGESINVWPHLILNPYLAVLPDVMHQADLGIFEHIVDFIRVHVKLLADRKKLDRILRYYKKNIRGGNMRLPTGQYFEKGANYQAYEHRSVMQILPFIVTGFITQEQMDALVSYIEWYLECARTSEHTETTLIEFKTKAHRSVNSQIVGSEEARLRLQFIAPQLEKKKYDTTMVKLDDDVLTQEIKRQKLLAKEAASKKGAVNTLHGVQEASQAAPPVRRGGRQSKRGGAGRGRANSSNGKTPAGATSAALDSIGEPFSAHTRVALSPTLALASEDLNNAAGGVACSAPEAAPLAGGVGCSAREASPLAGGVGCSAREAAPLAGGGGCSAREATPLAGGVGWSAREAAPLAGGIVCSAPEAATRALPAPASAAGVYAPGPMMSAVMEAAEEGGAIPFGDFGIEACSDDDELNDDDADDAVGAQAGTDSELHEAEVRVAELCASEMRAAELRAAELGASEVCAAEARAAELRSAELRAAEVRQTDKATPTSHQNETAAPARRERSQVAGAHHFREARQLEAQLRDLQNTVFVL
ncbi:unnamed protein product [Closterium sp. NIES-65]|nr:unnamed protein product [Closterium sp. NIES-65]